jgi:predicted permease
MACGFILANLGFFDEKTTGKLSAILTKFIIPANIIASFIRPFNKNEAIGFISAFGIDMAFFVVSAFIVSFIFKKSHNFKDQRMCTVFVNNGFFAFPLISALFGDYGIFIGSAHLSTMNIFLWTYGVYLCKGKESINIKSAIINPGLVGTVIGAIFFISTAVIPSETMSFLKENSFTSELGKNLYEALNMIKSTNTPLAMLVAGAWLHKAGIKNSITDFSVWKTSLVRMIVVPIVLFGIICFIPVSKDIKTVIMLGSSAPTAIISATFSQINNTDYIFCTKVITVTTLLSAITMPIFVMLLGIIP